MMVKTEKNKLKQSQYAKWTEIENYIQMEISTILLFTQSKYPPPPITFKPLKLLA